MIYRDRIKLKAALISTLFTFILAALKFAGYKYTGSSALFADSLHSLTDSLSSIFVTFGIFLSTRKSKKFPYGLFKVENLVSLVVSVLVIFAGVEIISKSLKNRSHLTHEITGLIITGISVLISLLLGLYKIHISRKTNSPSLKADGYHSMSDALSSVVVFTGILFYRTLPMAESVSGIIVAAILIYAGLEILKKSLLVLLDAQLREEDIQKIIDILKEYRGIKINFIRGRSSGSHYFIELGVSMPQRSLKRAHEITEEIERRIKDAISEVEDVVIHYEPLKKDVVVYAVPLLGNKPTVHIGQSERFLIFEVKNDGKRCYIVDNPGHKAVSGRGALALRTLLDEDVDVLLLPSSAEEGIITVVKEFLKVEHSRDLIDRILRECGIV